ncbi:acyl-CoA dehydratase activase [Parafannyhessea umbonata]|uniref:CoA-substrate-specific enzyme activase, putative n=1 Tax=Parafannyhessea umbonata TaxID=604330 RepID=A0A1H9QRG8_9ACTN|nr:acyl-CoA dehydratase activase [Parafannyhessea umbonata]SER62997.1 CoA-substrate-specific enzyme activase, putative [Parafannyhessea umbonata]
MSGTQTGEKDAGIGAVGIDVGSTATKAAVVQWGEVTHTLVVPTGFSGVDAAWRVRKELAAQGVPVDELPVVATGYGRVSVPFAGKTLTEITCHGRGAAWLFAPDGTVIDIGGQDTKVIELRAGRVCDFAMNDKCSAGTGKFLEVMATRMGVAMDELFELAAQGEGAQISSVCTVFAESEVISMIGRGEPRQNIAHGVVESVVARVVSLAGKRAGGSCFLTGGLCGEPYLVERLSQRLGTQVATCKQARFAGAIGAALLA